MAYVVLSTFKFKFNPTLIPSRVYFECGKDPRHLCPWGWRIVAACGLWAGVSFPAGTQADVPHSLHAGFLDSAPLSARTPALWFTVTSSPVLVSGPARWPPTPPAFSSGTSFFFFFFSGTSWLFYPFALSYPFSNCLVKFKFLKDRSFCFTEKRRKEEWHFSNFLGEIKFHFSLGALSMWPWKF